MSTTDGLQQVLARISTLGAGPPAISQIRDRFGVSLVSAVTASQPSAPPDVSTTPAAGVRNGTQPGPTISSSSSASVSPKPATSNTTATGSTAIRGAIGPWTDRLPPAGAPWANQIASSARQYGLDPEFLGAVVWTESHFNPTAVSPDGAIGMGQLMPATAEWLGVDPWNPAQNIDGAARYYRNLVDRFGSLELATAAYFAGPTAVSNAGGVPHERAASYVAKVLGRRDYLAGTSPTPP